MPNGYTSDIYEGKPVTLRQFLMTVGRGMSMAIMQRDESLDEPVKLRQVSDYDAKALDKALRDKHRLIGLSPQDRNAEAASEWRVAKAAHQRAKRERDAMRQRYESMIEQVEAWEPDPKVAYVKEHALKYLHESMQFDCPPDRVYPSDPGDTWNADEWFDRHMARIERDIAYHEEALQEELERVADFNEHILAFHRSLPDA